jgi:predicted CXXCH cytochrome family protein
LLTALFLGGVLGATSCSGEVGPAGPAGADGTNGVDGKDGTNGTNGTNGVDGTSGVDGKDGIDGTSGTDGKDGTNGTDGKDGTDGTDGKNGGNVQITNFHGNAAVLKQEMDENGKYYVDAVITAAKVVNGQLTVDFTVADKDGTPHPGVPAVTGSVAKLIPPAAGEAWNRWVPYIYRSQVVSGSANGNWPNPDGTAADQGYRENNGVLTDNGDGSYTYVFKTDLTTVKTPVGMADVPFEANRRTRVSLMMGGGTGATAEAHFDFVPDGSALANAESREIVTTSTCKSCHGPEFAAHGGDRLSVENCVTCHAPGSTDPHGGETIDFGVMIHKIHAGGELATIPGPDGIVWDNPATAVNESADNGHYAIWGFQNQKQEWWKVGFPAVIDNCAACHDKTGAQSDNWKNKPSRKICGSCHDNVNFATGVNHPGGVMATDANCGLCHQPVGNSVGLSVTAGHDFMAKSEQNKPEFKVNITISTPANGKFFMAGESPVVNIQLKDLEAPGTPVIDHSNLTADPTAEGCTTSPCPAKDGLLAGSSFFVHGPRGHRNPVLTTKARVKITSTTAGPFDISAAGAKLDIKFDGGKDLYLTKNGGTLAAGLVSVPVSGGVFASTAAASADEVVVWLNANAAFKARGIAYKEPDGKVSIRSRNLGELFAVQLVNGPASCTGVLQPICTLFANNMAVITVGGSTPSNSIAKQANPANNDPKVQWFADHITYNLDPVDDLAPGTYIVTAEITDRGRKSATDYKTPSVAKVPFQVGTATEELPPAANCDSCHESKDGAGLILDYSRHYKILDQTATDQCGACHDYQTQTAAGDWAGAKPISRRVHAVHNGSALNYPLITVGYANGDPVAGRNWDITLPQNVRNCDVTCHEASTTSGSWKTDAARGPCYGCHDSDAARAHMKIMTYDPTPLDPWSGDEEESCKACH